MKIFKIQDGGRPPF